MSTSFWDTIARTEILVATDNGTVTVSAPADGIMRIQYADGRVSELGTDEQIGSIEQLVNAVRAAA